MRGFSAAKPLTGSIGCLKLDQAIRLFVEMTENWLSWDWDTASKGGVRLARPPKKGEPLGGF
jgi:hypothetical protein